MKYAVAMMALMMSSMVANAAELRINPGRWETKTTHTNPMTGTRTRTNTECVKDTTFDPEEMLASAEDCNMIRKDLDGNTLDFQMKCEVEGGAMDVTGMYQVDDDSGKGNMDMKMDMGGMTMNMKMNWTATRLGDCE